VFFLLRRSNNSEIALTFDLKKAKVAYLAQKVVTNSS